MAVAAMAVGAMAVVLLPLLAAVSARGLPFLARRPRCSKSLSAALLLLPLLLRAGLELSRRLTDAWAERPFVAWAERPLLHRQSAICRTAHGLCMSGLGGAAPPHKRLRARAVSKSSWPSAVLPPTGTKRCSNLQMALARARHLFQYCKLEPRYKAAEVELRSLLMTLPVWREYHMSEE